MKIKNYKTYNYINLIYSIGLIFFVSPLESCKTPQSKDSKNLGIIGSDDLKTFGFYEGPFASSMGLVGVTIGGTWKTCTGTHIGKGLVLTAGHCLAFSELEFQQAQRTCDQENQVVISGVFWGPTNEFPRGYLNSKCMSVEALSLKNQMDYAVFRVSPEPPTLLKINTKPIIDGTKIRVVGFPTNRPNNQGTKLSLSNECTTKRVPDLPTHTVAYECDTSGGMSGAPLINDAGEVVGIHIGFKSQPTPINFGIPLNRISYFKSP